MLGTSKVIVTEETIKQALGEHFNERVLRPVVRCTDVNYEYKGSVKEWYVMLEAVVDPTPSAIQPSPSA
jgi:hypothetical protein